MPAANRRAARAAAGAAAAVALGAAGCATIPTSGSVHTGRALGEPSPANASVIQNRPRAGEAPAAIVRGFLSALALPGEAGAASAYLTSAAAKRWHPGPAVTVYNDRTERLHSTGDGHWVLRSRRVAVISPTGRWTVAPAPLTLHFRLTRIGGQWHIASPPNRLVLAEADLAFSYQEYQLAFLGAATGHQVDVPVVLRTQQPGLANALVRSLLAGPPHGLAGAVTTAAPPGTATIGNVTVSRGTADVNLTSAARGVPTVRLRTLAEQLMLTLQQVPGVLRVRLLVDRSPLVTVDSAAPIELSTSSPADLVLVQPSGTAEEVGSPIATELEPSSQPPRRLLGHSWPLVTAALPQSTGEVVAATPVRRGKALLEGPVSRAPRRLATADSVQPVQSLDAQTVVVLDGRRLVTVVGHQVHPIRLPRYVRSAGVQTAAIAPDGAGFAVIVGPPGDGRLLVGALRPDRRVVGLHQVIALDDPRGVGWSTPDEITTTEMHGRHRVLVGMDQAGFAVRRSALPGSLRTVDALCAAPQAPVVLVGDGYAWRRQVGQWTRLGQATWCGYPG